MPCFQTPDNHICDESKNEENQQHPRNALQAADYRAVDLHDPAFGVEHDGLGFLGSGNDVFLQVPNPHTTGNTDNINRECKVSQPRPLANTGSQCTKTTLTRVRVPQQRA